MELQVSVQTADVLRLTVRDPLGTVTREWFQSAWRAIDKVRVPTVVVRTVYRSGLLSMLTMTVLEHARFQSRSGARDISAGGRAGET